MDFLFQPETYISLITLTFLEIVLGIDNIIFISIITDRLPEENQKRIRTIGLLLALVMRIILLSLITFIIQLKEPLFTLSEHAVSVRDVILFLGGTFLLAKSVSEIHEKTEGGHENKISAKKHSVGYVIMQILLLDIVFSFDSILTAIGLSNRLAIMITAIVIAMIAMIYFVEIISRFIKQHPTFQVLALSFLILIGFMLILDGFHFEIPKGYIYFALFFSVMVEVINTKVRKKAKRSDQIT
ncbi:MAG: TerC family protein [Prolixibacteraceae bacterium]|jgi:predicted tellurium resistance membrane protein TerC|nr:TerC family protein [Prolixibacteraceae bacterium]MBT6004094.1 TerC family protein [Prolixibacteraceae bacterium]MBT6765172.1 TerC family protein [Prolixibacteraceae bacterium]MBT7001011.1 TerC family protein [Prolixibacteraceae bacterium]MBT7393701.1 TerC family protein [Prolixibacteraceae bacterium]